MIEIESLILEEKFVIAESKILDLFVDYEPIFEFDIMVAAQLCALNKHFYLSLEFLEKAIKKGVEVENIKNLAVFEPVFELEKWKKLEKRLDRLQYNYLVSINFELAKEFERRFKAEQAAKGTDRFDEVVQDNFNHIIEVIAQYGFPGEELIGAKTYTVTTTLVNQEYAFSLLQEELLEALKKGQLQPSGFLYIYKYEARKISINYRDQAPPVEIDLPEFNIVALPESDSKILREERYKLGISSVGLMEKKAVRQKYGLRF
ncbi:MAG: hypothetical protein AAF705_00835 [Bacteroidota bacterium]